MALNTLSITIPAGKSVSDPLDCSGSIRIVRLIMPSSWTAAPITFCMSVDNVTYHDLYHVEAGKLTTYEVTLPNPVPDSTVSFPPNTGAVVAWFKIRSGTHAVPVIQPAARTFQVVVEVADAAAGGEAGAAGPTGPAGVAGSTGPAGVAGPTGSIGPPGAMGAQGLAGPTGPTGTASSKGVVDGSTGAAGDKGEYISAYNAVGLNLVTAVSANVVTLNLPPGDFDIWGAVIFTPTATGPNSLSAGISGVSATLPSNTDVISGFGTMAEIWSGSITSGKRQVYPTGQCTSNFATAKTVYLVAQSTFGGGSINVTGYISARRAR